MVTVECDDCMVTTWTYGDAHEAIAAWNRRASPDEHLLRKAAEELEHAAMYIGEESAIGAQCARVADKLNQRIGRGK
jgi:uncharacterized protein YaeQ